MVARANGAGAGGRAGRGGRLDGSVQRAGLGRVQHVPAGDGNSTNVWSDAVLWTHSSGATIFSAGTIQWSWGVDDGYNDGYCGCFHTYTNAATQRITQNVLDRFIGP